MPKTRKASAKTDRAGVNAVEQIIVNDLDWIFREQPTDDFGLDAQFEVVENETVTGRLIGAQIKSGTSYFKKEATGGWWFGLNSDDLDYWLDHSLPVVVVLYDPSTSTAYWESVTKDKIVPTKRGGRKLLIPEEQQLGSGSKKKLAKLAEGKPYELRLRQLRLALPWMNLIQGGRRILLEADEWINKTSGRGDLQVVSVDEANEDREELGTWFLMAGSRRYEDVLPSLAPWADVVLHEETYEQADYEAWGAECVWYDDEGDRMVSETYADWRLKFLDAGLRPYENAAGEVDRWRLELVLNELGKAFLRVDDYAEGEGDILTP